MYFLILDTPISASQKTYWSEQVEHRLGSLPRRLLYTTEELIALGGFRDKLELLRTGLTPQFQAL
jgi:hypothetical protein